MLKTCLRIQLVIRENLAAIALVILQLCNDRQLKKKKKKKKREKIFGE